MYQYHLWGLFINFNAEVEEKTQHLTYKDNYYLKTTVESSRVESDEQQPYSTR